jgi:hypothetical protein
MTLPKENCEVDNHAGTSEDKYIVLGLPSNECANSRKTQDTRLTESLKISHKTLGC